MSSTYIKVNEGDPIVPFDIVVKTTINVQCSFPNETYTDLTPGTPEFDALWQAYANDFENSYKDQPFFTIKDTNRNAVALVVADPNRPELEGKQPYLTTVQFTIENAEVSQNATINSELTGAELDAYILAYANDLGQRFKDERNWVNL